MDEWIFGLDESKQVHLECELNEIGERMVREFTKKLRKGGEG